MRTIDEFNKISGSIIGKAIEIHKALGSGLLESAYKECLFYELVNAGLEVEKEKSISIRYKNLI